MAAESQTYFNIPFQDEWLNIEQQECNSSYILEILNNNLLVKTEIALLEADIDRISGSIKLNNLVNARDIIINFKDGLPCFMGGIEVVGCEANVYIFSSKGMVFKSITTKNIKNFYVIGSSFNGLNEDGSFNYSTPSGSKVWIDSLNANSLNISSSKVIIGGKLNLEKEVDISLYGESSSYSLDTQKLQFLTSASLNILDESKDSAGVNIFGSITTLGINKLTSNNNIVIDGNIEAKNIQIYSDNTININNNLFSTSIITDSDNLIIGSNSHLGTFKFADNKENKANDIKLKARKLFECKEGAELVTGNKIYIKVDEKLNINCEVISESNTIIGGKATNKKISNKIVSKAGNIIVNTVSGSNNNLEVSGLVIALSGNVNYNTDGNFVSDGISIANKNLIIDAKQGVNFSAANKKAITILQKGMQEKSENNSNLISLEGEIKINSRYVDFKDGKIVALDKKNGCITVNAHGYIKEAGSWLEAAQSIIKYAKGADSKGYSIVIAPHSVIRGNKVIHDVKNTILLEGQIESINEVFLSTQSLEITALGTIISSEGEINIILRKGDFQNYGSIGSNKLVKISVNKGHFTNHNLLLSGGSAEFYVHNNHNFVNYGKILVNDQAKFALMSRAKITFTHGSITHVGSYSMDHIAEQVGWPIGRFECIGCEFISLNPDVENLIRAEVISAKIAYYRKGVPELVGTGRFLYDKTKEKEWYGNVIRHDHYTTISAYKENHEYYGIPHMQSAGATTLNTGQITLEVAEMQFNRDLTLEGNPNLT